MAKPFIEAYKDGSNSVDSYIRNDSVIYWYRPQMKSADCHTTDNCMTPIPNNRNYFVGPPDGHEQVSDNVFIVTLLTEEAHVTVQSGTNSQDFDAPAGASATFVPMGVGQQTFKVTRKNADVLSGTSLKDIIDGCVCGLYNFNAYGESPSSLAPHCLCLKSGLQDPFQS